MDKIADAVTAAVKKVFAVDTVVEVTPAPESAGADWATNVALRLAKQVGKNPMEVALGIVSRLDLEDFEVAVAAPGFINFISRDEYLKSKIADLGRNFDKNISQDEYSGKTVVCEFSDPNPFKVLHVGHLYTSIMGEAISRLVENAGGQVHRVNFGGDVGLHVAKTIWALKDSNSEFDINEIAKAYVAGTRAYEEDEQARREIVELNKEIYDIALNNKHENKIAEIYWKGREMSYAYFDDFYAKINVKFEKYYPESTVAKLGLKKVQEQVGKVYEESDGAVVFRGEKYGLHTRVFINKEGLPTYEAKDTGLIFQKFDDYHFDESVVITGNDIIDYMKVVLKAVSLYAPELAERTTHITHGNVRLAGNEKMSSRKGNFLKAVDVIEMVRRELKEKYNTTDERVVMAAVKYAFLKYKIGGNIVFDLEESVSMNGNSGPYILYSVVRAKKILTQVMLISSSERVMLSSSKDSDSHQPKNVPQKSQHNLSRKLLQYSSVLKEATEMHAPHILCNYLFEVAQEFSRFYENVKVAGSDREAELAQLVKIFVQVMEHGLNLLGIEAPEEM